MNFVLISTYYKYGGAELQALFEKSILEKRGHRVLYLTFDPRLKTGDSIENGHLNVLGDYCRTNKRLSSILINISLLKKLRKILRSFNAEIIHLHNVTYAFPTIAMASNQYEVIQTIHDYSYLCDKSPNCVYEDFRVCDDFSFDNCRRNCFSRKKHDLLVLVYRRTIRIIQFYYRKKYINHIVCPSKLLCKHLNDMGYEAININNALDASVDSTDSLKPESRTVLMYGSIRKDKGVYQLLDAYNSSDYKKLQLEIIGPLDDEINLSEFNRLVNDKGAIYHCAMSHDEISKKLQSVFAVIIPSLCVENYPNVALEGMLNKCVVCGSNRGGIPEMVTDKKLLFDILNPNEITNCLHYLDDMDKQRVEEICASQTEYFSNHNTSELYLEKIGSLIGKEL